MVTVLNTYTQRDKWLPKFISDANNLNRIIELIQKTKPLIQEVRNELLNKKLSR
jgi:hypothetical protein